MLLKGTPTPPATAIPGCRLRALPSESISLAVLLRRVIRQMARLVLLRYVLWATREPRFGTTISANSGPCEQEILDLTSRPRQGPPRSFFYCARFPG
jgi:hypothetical protein